MLENIRVDFNKTELQIEESKRGRMKITFKMTKDEAESFKNFMEMVKPENIPDDQFFKHVFFAGCKVLNDELRQLFEEQKAKLDAQKKLAQAAETIVSDNPIDDVNVPSNIIQGSFGQPKE